MSDKKNPKDDVTDVKALASEAAKFAEMWDNESVSDPAIAEAMKQEFGEEAVKTIATDEIEAGDALEPAENETLAVGEEVALEPVTENEVEGDSAGENAESSSGEPVEAAFVKEEYNLPKELADAQAKSVIESILFASVHPVTFATLKSVFQGTNINTEKLNDVLTHLTTDYAGGERGVNLEEVGGGYQLRTKIDNAGWLKKMVKARPFKLSGPALEVLSIIAYKQPMIKGEVDQIRGVESGHLVRALMEKNLVKFAGKSEVPGKPMLYGTTKQFLELFGLRNIRELPTLSEIDKLIPDGIGEISEIEGETLGALAEKIGLPMGKSYSDSEAELLSITDALGTITTSSDFFEQEKNREKQRREEERAQDLRERRIVGEELTDADSRWLNRFEAKIEATLKAQAAEAEAPAVVSEESQNVNEPTVEAFSSGDIETVDNEAEADAETESDSDSENDADLQAESSDESEIEESDEETDLDELLAGEEDEGADDDETDNVEDDEESDDVEELAGDDDEEPDMVASEDVVIDGEKNEPTGEVEV